MAVPSNRGGVHLQCGVPESILAAGTDCSWSNTCHLVGRCLCCFASSLQHQLPSDKQSKEQWWYPFAKIGCGAAAGIAAQTASYPLDTLRRRLQVNGAPGTSVRYRCDPVQPARICMVCSCCQDVHTAQRLCGVSLVHCSSSAAGCVHVDHIRLLHLLCALPCCTWVTPCCADAGPNYGVACSPAYDGHALLSCRAHGPRAAQHEDIDVMIHQFVHYASLLVWSSYTATCRCSTDRMRNVPSAIW